MVLRSFHTSAHTCIFTGCTATQLWLEAHTLVSCCGLCLLTVLSSCYTAAWLGTLLYVMTFTLNTAGIISFRPEHNLKFVIQPPCTASSPSNTKDSSVLSPLSQHMTFPGHGLRMSSSNKENLHNIHHVLHDSSQIALNAMQQDSRPAAKVVQDIHALLHLHQ